MAGPGRRDDQLAFHAVIENAVNLEKPHQIFPAAKGIGEYGRALVFLNQNPKRFQAVDDSLDIQVGFFRRH